MRLFLFFFTWILWGVSFASTETSTKKITKLWPTCIAQYCFDKQAPKEIDLIKSYGTGVNKTDGETSWHCYEIPEKKSFMKFTVHNDISPFIVGVVISYKPICEEAARPIKSFDSLKTKEGVAVGDKYEKVLRIYGNPQYVRAGKELVALSRDYFFSSLNVADSDVAIAYGPNAIDDLLVTWFYFRKGKLAAISMSISE